MKVYTYGDENKPLLLLLPGTCCHHSLFDRVIPCLQENFLLAVVSYDGFDESESTTFPSILEEVALLEGYLMERFAGHVFAVYGSSLGGSMASLMLCRRRVGFDYVILGSSDLDQMDGLRAKILAKLFATFIYRSMQRGKLPFGLSRLLSGLAADRRKYLQKSLQAVGIGASSCSMSFVSRQSIFNQFYSDLITPLPDNICIDGTKVHIFYALKMGEKYARRYARHFRNADIRMQNLEHEELLLCQPDAWVKEVKACVLGK